MFLISVTDWPNGKEEDIGFSGQVLYPSSLQKKSHFINSRSFENV
jgi:hypothetical protein